MTISNETVLVTHTANGVTTDWPFTFPVLDDEHLVVKLVDLTDYSSSVIAPASYALTLNGDGTGSVEYPLNVDGITVFALDAPYGIIIKRELPLEQTLAAQKSQLGALAAGLNTQLDKIVMMIQQLADALDRVPMLEDGDPSDPLTALQGEAGPPGSGLLFAASDESTALAVASNVVKVPVYEDMSLTGRRIIMFLSTPSSSGVVRADIKHNGVSIFSTPIECDANESWSHLAAVQAVLVTTEFSFGDVLSVDILQAGTGARGLKLILYAAEA